MLQGDEGTPESAQAVLKFLEEHFEINPALKQAIIGRFKTPRVEN